ncbi:MAG: ribokinase [Armatimonadetes bacterium]|nr:ribokinase [Armatimonadota bacterium]
MAVRLAVVGNINVDFLLPCQRLPGAGENIVADSLQLLAGGKGANQAVAAARLGAEVTLVGRVGRDPFGTVLKNNLAREGINVDFVGVDEKVPTGCAFVLVLPKAENAIISALGANMQLTPAHVEEAFEEIEELDAILVQMGIPLEAVDRAIQIGTDRGVPVLLDPTPLRGKFPRLWRHTTVITPNASEAEALTGVPTGTVAGAVEAALAIHEKGVPSVVVKLGKRGCVIADDEGVRRVKAYEVQAVDPTGAGDAFAAALAVRLAEGASLDEAVVFASATAAIACTKAGAQSSLPTRKQLEGFISRRGKRGMVSPVRK